MLSRVFSYMVMGMCYMSVNMMVVSLAVFIRSLPAMGSSLRRLLEGGLRWSYRVYDALLSRLSPLLHRLTGINLLGGLPRTIASMMISMLIGAGLSWLLGQPFGIVKAVICGLHGLVVGVLWDELSVPSGIHLGQRVR